jgi:hypothetical protein
MNTDFISKDEAKRELEYVDNTIKRVDKYFYNGQAKLIELLNDSFNEYFIGYYMGLRRLMIGIHLSYPGEIDRWFGGLSSNDKVVFMRAKGYYDGLNRCLLVT